MCAGHKQNDKEKKNGNNHSKKQMITQKNDIKKQKAESENRFGHVQKRKEKTILNSIGDYKSCQL
jgi:hypothetical protein